MLSADFADYTDAPGRFLNLRNLRNLRITHPPCPNKPRIPHKAVMPIGLPSGAKKAAPLETAGRRPGRCSVYARSTRASPVLFTDQHDRIVQPGPDYS